MWKPMSRLKPEPELRDATWRDYQPAWWRVLLYGFGTAGVFGGLSLYQTGSVEVLGLAGIGGLLICIYLRWIGPQVAHQRSVFEEPD